MASLLKSSRDRDMWKAEDDGRRSLLKDDFSHSADSAPSDHGSMLQDYSTDFARLRAVAEAKVRALRESAGGSKWAEDARAAERALEAMESTRRQVQVQLRLELSGSAGGVKQEWDQRLQEWAREVASFRGELEAFREDHGRRTLRLDGRDVVGGGLDDASRAGRKGAMRSTELLERSTQQLEEAARQALETEEVSQGVMSDLAAQRDVISSMRTNMRTIGSELSSARQSLGRMLSRAKQNQLVTSVVGSVLGVSLTFWLLCFLGLPLQYTVMLAVAFVLLCSAVAALRRRLAPAAPPPD